MVQLVRVESAEDFNQNGTQYYILLNGHNWPINVASVHFIKFFEISVASDCPHNLYVHT